MTGICFWAVAAELSRITPMSAGGTPFEIPTQLGKTMGWPRIVILGRRVSDNEGLCPPERDLQLEVDIAQQLRVRKGQAIWE